MFTCLTLILTLFDVLFELVTFMSLEVTQAPVTRELLLLWRNLGRQPDVVITVGNFVMTLQRRMRVRYAWRRISNPAVKQCGWQTCWGACNVITLGPRFSAVGHYDSLRLILVSQIKLSCWLPQVNRTARVGG